MPDLFVAKEKKEHVSHTSTLKNPYDHSSQEQKPHTTPQPSEKKALQDELASPQKQNKVHLLSSFTKFPEGIRFENQEENERIYLFLRRHFMTNIGWLLSSVLFALLPLFIWVIVGSLGMMLFELPFPYLLVLILFYYSVILGYAFINFVIWFYNVGIVTQIRVVDIDIHTITSKNVAATGIGDIVDVEYSQHGFLASFLNYGDVNLQTEGLKPNFEFHKIPHPALVADIISDLIGGRPINE